MNLMMLLEMASSSFPDRVAVTNDGLHMRYGELFEAAAAAAEEVEASGAAHLAMLDVSSPALPAAVFGSAWAGVPFVPLNYRLTGSELDRLLEQIAPAYLLTGADRVSEMSRRPGLTPISRDEFLSRMRRPGVAATRGEWPMDPQKIAVLLFTSGTTGPPKAAVLRHQHLVSYILGSVEFGSAAPEDASLVSVPPYHVAGIAALASSVYAGRRIVQLSQFTAAGWLELARAERVTHAFVVPTMLARIVDELEGDSNPDLPQLRALSYGGGRMPQSVIERAMALLPATEFANAYGLTETSSTISVLGPEDHREAVASRDPDVRRRLASVGRPLPSVEVEIRAADGATVAPGVTGEIHVRGEQVSGEYLGRASALLDDGWFPTRDGGRLDEEGYLFLEGRVDDVIVRGGENMSPGEIEDVLLEHEAVGDAAVVGLPDEQWGEAVAALVVLAPGRRANAGELQQWVKDRLRSSRTPERIEFSSELPYNEMGKLLRTEVRRRLLGQG